MKYPPGKNPAYPRSRNPAGLPATSPAERIKDKFEKRGDDECWPWIGLVNKHGRGRFYWDGVKKMINANRAVMMLIHGDIPAHLFACHTCDNQNCVNPAHLYLGTAQNNVRDAFTRGRINPNRGRKGSEHHRAKLTEEDVHQIRRLLAAGESARIVAERFGVGRSTVAAINTGRLWAHLSTPP